MDNKDDLGDRMKSYEMAETSKVLDVSLPIYARIDGRSFSKYTKGLMKPFDMHMSRAMEETTKYLVKNTNAIVGYTQSDEISLAWKIRPESQMMFGGKVQKLTSVIASMTAAFFANWVPVYKDGACPHFDCRIFNVPSEAELVNAFLWRNLDCHRNSISMVAQRYFSHKQLQNKSQKDMLEMLISKDVDYYNTIEPRYKFGLFVKKENYEVRPEDLNDVPVGRRPITSVIRTRTIAEAINFKDLSFEDKKMYIFGNM